ncbi:MAG: rhodanese-like domain-containing protein [Candidatus Krumholzibacteriota bacterium]
MLSAPSSSPAPAGTWWPASLREAGLLLLVAVLVTGVSWILRSDGLPLTADSTGYELELAAPLIGTEQALELFAEGEYLFVDARSAVETGEATIPGAFLIRAETFDDDLLGYFDFMGPEDHFILFGDGNLLPVSDVAARLMERGYDNVFILKGGLTAWRTAGGEISHRTGDES